MLLILQSRAKPCKTNVVVKENACIFDDSLNVTNEPSTMNTFTPNCIVSAKFAYEMALKKAPLSDDVVVASIASES